MDTKDKKDINPTNKRVKLKWMIISAVAMVTSGILLMFTGMIIKPMGEIHPSVLTAVGECLTFAGSLFGINANYRIKTTDWEVERNNKKEG